MAPGPEDEEAHAPAECLHRGELADTGSECRCMDCGAYLTTAEQDATDLWKNHTVPGLQHQLDLARGRVAELEERLGMLIMAQFTARK